MVYAVQHLDHVRWSIAVPGSWWPAAAGTTSPPPPLGGTGSASWAGLPRSCRAWALPRTAASCRCSGRSFTGTATTPSALATAAACSPRRAPSWLALVFGFLMTPFFARVLRFFPPWSRGRLSRRSASPWCPWRRRGPWAGRRGAGYGSLANIAGGGHAARGAAAVQVRRRVLSGWPSWWRSSSAPWWRGPWAWRTCRWGRARGSRCPRRSTSARRRSTWRRSVAMCIVILVNMAETTADILARPRSTGSRIDSARIADGLRGHALLRRVPAFNSFTQTAFVHNGGPVAITKVKSRYVVALGGVFMVLLGMLPVLGQVIAAIPPPVTGWRGLRAVRHRDVLGHPHPGAWTTAAA
ncbi:solute carrier family 23 protein [Kocuria rhizophila]|nr:solute carrier family 23 protein [Kocuria rhizophila]